MDMLAEHPYINEMTETLNALDVKKFYDALEESKNYRSLMADAVPGDDKQLIFTTKGKDAWTPLFAQLISVQEGEDVSVMSLAQSYKQMTMKTALPKKLAAIGEDDEDEDEKPKLKTPLI